MKSLSIVVPVYNAERTIGHLCATLIGLYGSQYALEIVLVNDGSVDSSDVICRQLHSDHPEVVTYLRLSRNFGEHNAVMAGLSHVNSDYCVIMDDDFQNPPAEVGKLLSEIAKGYDVVYARYHRKNDSLFRNIGSWLNDRMANVILEKPRDLYLSSFKVLSRFAVREVVRHTSPDPYIDALILRITGNIGSVEISHAERAEGDSGYTFKKLIGLWGNMVMSYSLVPLRIIGMVGLFLVVIGALYGVHKAYDDIDAGIKLSEYESLMFANMIFRGLVLLAISLVGEYIGRIHMALSRDPQFVVREHLFAKKAAAVNVAYLKER